MKRAGQRPSATARDEGAEARFARVVGAFVADPKVTRGANAGFGRGALRTNGKIFAMISPREEFVVKLPVDRVRGLIASGAGRPFGAGRGRPMREWLVVDDPRAWVRLAKEALRFVGSVSRIEAHSRPGDAAPAESGRGVGAGRSAPRSR